MNLSEHIRTRLGMYLQTFRTYSGGVGQNWEYLFYNILHAFGFYGGSALTICVSVEKDGEFCFKADGHFFMKDDLQFLPPMMSSFSISQNGLDTVVRFKPDSELWPDAVYDVQILILIMKDYAYLHPDQAVVWKDEHIHYKNGIKDLLVNEFGVTGNLLFSRSDHTAIALSKNNTGEVEIIDYLNDRRTDGGVHAYALKKAVKSSLPDIAKAGYTAVLIIHAPYEYDIKFEGSTHGKIGSMPQMYLDDITKAVAELNND